MAEHHDPAEVAAVRHHIEFKASMRELAEPVKTRMLAALDAGAAPDYATLLEAATFLPLPYRCYHTAPVTERANIEASGLVPYSPSAGTNWGDKAAGQTEGVYVGAEPDVRGVWAHEDAWDVWEIDTSTLPATAWDHDRLNPGSWVITTALAADLVRLRSSHYWNQD